MTPDRPTLRLLTSARDGVVVVAGGLASSWLLTAVASLAYRPRGHTGSPLDWLRIAGYAVAMSVGAPLRFRSGGDHGQLRIVPLTVTVALVLLAARRGRGRSVADAVACAVAAAVVVGLVALTVGSRLSSYGRHLQVHYAVPALPATVGALAVVGVSYALGSRRWTGAWARAAAAALTAAGVVGAVACAVAIVGALAWQHFPSRGLGLVPGLLGDGAAWLGGFSLGGRLTADLSSPIPLLSGNLGLGLVTGGAWLVAYLLLVVPAAAAVLAGRRQQRGAPDGTREWAEFGRAVICNAGLWLVLAEASRLRFSGRLGADLVSGTAGLDPTTTVFVAALWGAVSAVAGLALGPVPERLSRRRSRRSSR
jgi:hypothetical protein